jgi:hypothetical protein
VILRLSVSKAGTTLEIDDPRLGRRRLVRSEDGDIVLGCAAAEESDGAGRWIGIVQGDLEEVLGDEELARDDVALTAEELGRGDSQPLEDHGDGRFMCWCCCNGISISSASYIQSSCMRGEDVHDTTI